jgi:Fic family protein
VQLSSRTTALVTEASAEIARFDEQTLGTTTSFAALLLRTEAASFSREPHLLGQGHRPGHALMAGHMPAAAGRWRTEQVWIGGSGRSPHGATYIAPVHQRVPDAIDDLVSFVARDDIPVLAQAAATHAQFESIHPFADGNGRTGRTLMHAQIRNSGLARHAIVPVSAGLLTDTDRCFQALTVYRDGDLDPIVAAVAQAVFPALANSRQLIDDVTTARANWNDRIRARRGAAAWKLADLVRTRPVVDVRLAAEKLGVTTVNAQLAIDRLVEDDVIEQIGLGVRNRAWQATDVLAAMDRFADRSHRRAW